MKITEIHIHPVTAKGGLVAFAHLVLDDKLLIGSIAIYEKRGGGYRITFPQKRENYVYHPIDRPFGKQLEQAITLHAKTVLEKPHAGHHRPESAL